MATDFEKTFSSNALEPVMYISEACWVKVAYHGIPEGCPNDMHQGTRLLNICDYIFIYLCTIIF